MEIDKTNIICTICKENKWKYKCPTCTIEYCSVQCYKNHKNENLCQISNTIHSSNDNNNDNNNENNNKISNKLKEPESEDDDVTLSNKKLECIKNSKTIRNQIRDSRLQQMILDIDEAMDRREKLEKALLLPQFASFAEKLLEVINLKE